jgi:hypothetical protein
MTLLRDGILSSPDSQFQAGVEHQPGMYGAEHGRTYGISFSAVVPTCFCS